MNVEPIRSRLEPLRKTVRVQCSVEEAFEVFTNDVGRWWPMATHSVSGERTVEVAIEPREGGSFHEVRDDGERFTWGRVVTWEPPARFVFTWHPGRQPDTAQEVEVRFVTEDGGTRVELEHRGWDSYGEGAEEARQSYDSGWEGVLGKDFAGAC